eukprot:1347376-Amorphochlora_amoeboformis.AAC.2
MISRGYTGDLWGGPSGIHRGFIGDSTGIQPGFYHYPGIRCAEKPKHRTRGEHTGAGVDIGR